MTQVDLIVIGAGPGGYETAAEAAASGKRVVIVEKDLLGGTCLNRGCIPTKALCKSAEVLETVKNASVYEIEPGSVTASYASAVARKNEIVEALREGVTAALKKVTVVNGEARFVSAHVVAVGEDEYTAPQIIIATGSRPASLSVPGAELAIDSDKALAMEQLPASICIVGGGVIGMEFAAIFAAYGVQVTVIEYCKEILPPFDRDISKRLKSILSRRGVNIITQAAVTAIRPGKAVEYQLKGESCEIVADEVLMAVGRRAVVPDGCEAVGIEVGRKGIVVNDMYETTVPGVYAIGDANGVCMLAHAATAQGAVALGHDVNASVVPSAVFTSPECAMVGLTEEQCKEQGVNYKSAKSLYRANGKALTMGDTDGLVKIIIDAESRKILGCHILGAHAADLIQEVATAMSNSLTIDAIARTVHIHPSLTEVVLAAAKAL